LKAIIESKIFTSGRSTKLSTRLRVLKKCDSVAPI
jgi:hypothetical protein